MEALTETITDMEVRATAVEVAVVAAAVEALSLLVNYVTNMVTMLTIVSIGLTNHLFLLKGNLHSLSPLKPLIRVSIRVIQAP